MSYQSPFHMKMRSITNQKIKNDSQKRNHIKDIEGKVLKQTSHQTTPNMKNAYLKVQQNDYEPSEEEIAYHQFATSGFVKH